MKGRSAQDILLTAAVLALLLAGGCETHLYYGEGFGEQSVDLAAYKSVQDRLDHGEGNRVAAAVSISGGGHRAANFAAGILLELEDIRRGEAPWPNALSEVDYFSTVSGGGLAAAAYLSSLHDHIYFGEEGPYSGSGRDYSFARAMQPRAPGQDGMPPPAEQRTDPDLRFQLERGYVEDIVEGMFSLASLGAMDSGDFLENALDSRVLGHDWRQHKLTSSGDRREASLCLGDLFVRRDDPRPPRLPLWAANAMVYENGQMFTFSPDILRHYAVCGYVHRLQQVNHRLDRQTYEEFLDRFPLALALTASGNFPILIPPTSLRSSYDPHHPYLLLLDGGMADNLGVLTALRLLREDRHPAVERKALLVIDAYNGRLRPFSSQATETKMTVTAVRTMIAPLDSWRGRSMEIVRALAASPEFGGNITPVFFRLEDLVELKDFTALCPFGLPEAEASAWNARGTTPFGACRDIWTWYKIAHDQQNLLLAAGRYIAHKKAEEIRKALGWASPAPPAPPAATRPER